jgi:hypothetical protein
MKSTSYPFDFLKNCTTSSLTFSGCETTNFGYPNLPITALLWQFTPPDTSSTLTALPTSTPANKCLNSNYYRYTWDLNYGKTPSIPINDMKVVEYDFNTQPYYATDFNSVNFNIYVKTADLYTNQTPKYLEKLTNNCVNFTGSGPANTWYTASGSHGRVINGMACGMVGLYSGYNAGIFSVMLASPYDKGAIKILSQGNYYWVKCGFLPGAGGAQGSPLDYTEDGEWCTLYTTGYGQYVASFYNSSLTANTRTVGFSGPNPSYLPSCVYAGEYIIIPFYSWSWPFTECYMRVTNLNGSINDEMSNIPRNKFLYNSKIAVEMDGKLYLFHEDMIYYNVLNSISDPGTLPTTVDGNIYITDPGNIRGSSFAVHLGKIYAIREQKLVVLIEGSHFEEIPGVTLPIGGGSIVSYGDYLVIIMSKQPDGRYLPNIEIIPNSMLEI